MIDSTKVTFYLESAFFLNVNVKYYPPSKQLIESKTGYIFE
jgi:hypothetical protein